MERCAGGRAYRCTLKLVAIVWDSEKLKTNFEKHGVRFPDAEPAFQDPLAITVTDYESDPSEERFLTMGLDALGRVVVVVYAWRGDDIRLISARLANPHERQEYENQ